MTTGQLIEPRVEKTIRLWPGVAALILLCVFRFGLKMIIPDFRGFSLGMMWSFGAAGVILLWWLFFSRARWVDRFAAVGVMIASAAAAWQLRHESMEALWVAGYLLPSAFASLVVAAAASRRLPARSRRVTMAAVIVAACGVWTLLRTDGITGDHNLTFHWRWTKSAEERLLAAPPPSPPPVEAAKEPAATPEPPKVAETVTPGAPTRSSIVEWPGFRGMHRDGVVRGLRVATDWSVSPPVELWRRPIGPGWSSFAVRGDFVYTQEQRGEDEVVACYRASSGAPVWTHSDRARFFESNGGAGPRGTPAVVDGHVYTLGATGIVNALDARSGSVVWSRNAATDTGAAEPMWGFSGSPLVVGDLVIVAASGRFVAYDRSTGAPRWVERDGREGYASPQLATIDGVQQVLLVSGTGIVSVTTEGKRLWDHSWKGFPIVQPGVTDDGDVLMSASADAGTRRLAVTAGPNGWTVEERWTSRGLKPYFNDFVLHKGHAFGFDGRILSCIDLNDGERKWKGGRYGNGQLVLLAEQDLLLVLSDEGELALVNARPDAFTEVARVKALEGKTWNHPVVAGDVVLVRNGEEMAAFRLPVARR